MQETHCPICGDELEVREVAPCDDCGGDPQELSHFRDNKHQYAEYEVFPGLNLMLCDFCMIDFASYKPAFFGLADGTRLGVEKMNFVKDVLNASLGWDKFCPDCGYRLSFLRFLQKAREQHAG